MDGLYLVISETGRRLWVAWESGAAQMYVLVTATGKFHRNRGLAADFYGEQRYTYQPIDPPTARAAIADGVGNLDEQIKACQLARYRNDPAALDPATVWGSA